MKVKPRHVRDEIPLVLPPLALVLGMLLALVGLDAAVGPAEYLLLGFLPLAWFLARRTWLGAAAVCVCALLLGTLLGREALEAAARGRPTDADLGGVYQVEGRLSQAHETQFGLALRLDQVQVLSPATTVFRLTRLTVYVPPCEPRPAPGAQITAWLTLKRSYESQPIPWPMQELRNRELPRFYGSVKAAALWQCDRFEPPVANALSPGNRELLALALHAVPASLWQERLRPFGVGHLLSISGLHCLWVFLLLQLLLWPLPRPWLRLAATLAGLLAFGQFAGWTASVTRAVLTLGLWSLLPSLGRVRSWPRLWFSLFVLALVLDPTLLLLRGFWYSFAASLGLVLGGKARRFRPSPLEHPWLVRLRPLLPIVAAQLFVIPINLMFQGYARFTDLFWNFIGVLFLAALILQLGLAWCATLWSSLVPLANHSEALLTRVLAQLAELSFWEWVRWPQSPLWVFAVLVFLALSLRYGGREWRWYLACACMLAFHLLGRPQSGERLVFVDVGQGLCVLHVSATGEGTLYDAGGKLPGGLRLDRLVRLFGVRHLRAAYLSHMDLDHYQLLEQVPRTFPLWVAPSQRAAFAANPMLAGFPLCTTAMGDRERWGSYQVSVLWPPADEVAFPSDNEQSLVLLLDNGRERILLMGDAGLWTEAHVHLPESEEPLMLQVGHHGSKTSSGQAFLERSKPADAIISCGYRNQFSHPNGAVVERLTNQGALLWQTSETGSITIVDGEISVGK